MNDDENSEMMTVQIGKSIYYADTDYRDCAHSCLVDFVCRDCGSVLLWGNIVRSGYEKNKGANVCKYNGPYDGTVEVFKELGVIHETD